MYNIRYISGEYYINTDTVNTKITVDNPDYDIRDKDDLINDLIKRIYETKSESDKYLMKEDLKKLMTTSDDYIFSSTQTNEYVIKSLDEKEFNTICESFILLQK